jgi:hypothetical protein
MRRHKPGWCNDPHSDIPREVYEGILKSERKTSVPTRHKCAGCAYEAGIREGIRRAQQALGKVAKSVPEPVNPETGHREWAIG